MSPIPLKHRKIIAVEPFYQKCVRAAEGTCDGRITIEHAFIYSGRQIQELWNYVPLCWYHHLGRGFKKQYGQWIALMRGLGEAIKKYPKRNWLQDKKYLDRKFIC